MCLSKPKQMAIAKAECPVGHLIIAPEAMKISSCLIAKMDEVTSDTRAKVTLVDTEHTAYYFYAHPWIEQKRAAAFWFVEATDEPTKANMTYAIGSYDVTAGAEVTPPTGIKVAYEQSNGIKIVGKTALPKVENPTEDGHKHIVNVRLLVNHKVLKKDDVLRVYDKEGAQGGQRGDKRPAKAAAAISLSKVMRKR